MEFDWQHWLWLTSALATALVFLAVRPRSVVVDRWVTAGAALVTAAVTVEIVARALGWGTTQPIPELATVMMLATLALRAVTSRRTAEAGAESIPRPDQGTGGPDIGKGEGGGKRVGGDGARVSETGSLFHARENAAPRSGRQGRLGQDDRSDRSPVDGLGRPGSAGRGAGLLERTFEELDEAVAVTDSDCRIVFANPAWARLHGQRVDDILGHRFSLFHTPDQLAGQLEPLLRQAEAAGTHETVVERRRRDGSTFPSRTRLTRLDATADRAGGWLAEVRGPETERGESDPGEATRLAYLAREVVHGFNNLLSAIVGGAGLLLERLPPGSEIRSDLQDIESAAMRAAELAGELQAEARRIAPAKRPPTLVQRRAQPARPQKVG